MGKINILDEKTINKIAAGEVVQNGASVVKELVENSIDAGASGIAVEIEQGGVRKIRVTDNGGGILSADIERAFMRHATSKISTAADLGVIRSLGFRGEALSSIAAVSVMEIRTREKSEEMGSVLKLKGGVVESAGYAGLPVGTTIVVGNLFYNTPARLKFLKSTQVETGYITEIAAKYILAYPEISFHYSSNGETVFRSPGTGSVEESLISVYGRQILSKVKFLSHVEGDISISGYIGLPQFALKNRRHQSFFVNRRYVKNMFLSNALQNAYSQRILKGRFPFALLFIELSPGGVDVNVHPQKLEIKFQDEQLVEYALSEAVNAALSSAQITGSVESVSAPALNTAEPAANETGVTLINPLENGHYLGFNVRQSDSDPFSYSAENDNDDDNDDNNEEPEARSSEEEPGFKVQSSLLEPDIPEPKRYKYLGALFNSYLLLEKGENMLIIDQHAAHERILYDRLIERVKSKAAASQRLMKSELYACTAVEIELYLKNEDAFLEIGFDIELFGQHSLKISAVPDVGYRVDVRSMIDEMFYELAHGDARVLKRDALIAAMCRKAVKAEDALTDEEARYLINEYEATGAYPTCPHGRPIVTVVTKAELEKSFKRRI